MRATDKKICFSFFGAVSLIIVHVLTNCIWLKKDSFPLWFDYGAYFKRSISMFHASEVSLSEFANAVFSAGSYASSFHPHRIILPLFSMPWYYIFGIHPDVAVMSCTTFFAIAIFSTYAIASRIFDRLTGFLAAFILSVSPGFFTFYRRFSPEFAVTAMIGLAACFFLFSENFKKRKYSLLLGISLALCMLTKEMAFAFLPGILLYGIYGSRMFARFGTGQNDKRQRLVNLFLSLSVAVILTLPVYWMHRYHILHEIFDVAYSSEMRKLLKMVHPYSFRGLTYYARIILVFGFLPFYTAFCALGIFFSIKNKIKHKAFLFLWMIVSYLILCSVQTRAFEYTIPNIIPLSILASHGITSIFKKGSLKAACISFATAWGIAQLLISSFQAPGLPRWVLYRNIIAPRDFREYHPVHQDWQLEKIIDYIVSVRKDAPGGTKKVHVGANLYAFSPVTLDYVAAWKKAKLKFSGYSVRREDVPVFDFVIVKSGENQGIFYSYKEAQALISLLESRDDFVKLPRKFPLHDGSHAEIYRKKNSTEIDQSQGS